MTGDPLLLGGVFIVAALYASVGHGGASGYLAVLSLFGLAPAAMKSSALLLNLLVAAISWRAYSRAGQFDPGLFWPLAAASIPAAFLGGFISLPPKAYAGLLAASLVAAAARLALPGLPEGGENPPTRLTAAGAGAGIGFVSALVGVGGGIFLSPLMILARWATAKRAAAVSAAFIWVNSAAALVGYVARGQGVTWFLAPLAVAASAGGILGARLGAERLSSPALKRLLAVALLIAAWKLARTALA